MRKSVTDFRVLPTAVFRCIECNEWMKIEQSLPDVISTGATCQHCHADYQVIWSRGEHEITVEMVQGKIISR